MIFTKEQLQQMVYGDYEEDDKEALWLVDSHITGISRWSVDWSGVFSYKGKHYQTFWSVGATECQEEHPFEYDEEKDCDEVVQKKVLTTQWVPVGETSWTLKN